MATKIIPLILLMTLLVSSCGSRKNIVYLQDLETHNQEVITNEYEIKVHRDDMLSIMVNSQNPELALPFNMPTVSYQLGTAGGNVSQQRVLGYLVDADGNIDFPILGKLHVEGLTRRQLVQLIKEKLISEDLIKDPIVTVEFRNFKVSVIGEVNNPGSFNISSERVTLLDALSMAGDLTIYGKRDRVVVIREDGNERTIGYHDLRSADIFTSPYYYLQQNDIIYVEPNKSKAGQSNINQNNSVSVWISGLSFISSMVVLVLNLVNN
ncbi:polysaccharide biosynthesis/export family protein [Parabacteroides sp. OttesenSCG-928-G07]|nr:polysaccharide biosynthesis/export family protein [Parabacteroides sp. OttesenSCG-928-G21]MDL2278079.1 polysaccharide biosynthesis/export family protein [Parabacteroides sp. OttesenSCG-928-G07]